MAEEFREAHKDAGDLDEAALSFTITAGRWDFPFALYCHAGFAHAGHFGGEALWGFPYFLLG